MTEQRAGYTTPTTCRIPLPPTGANHQYRTRVAYRDGQPYAVTYRSAGYKLWLAEVALMLRGWTPPERVPLYVRIALYIPTQVGRNADIDGYVKPLLDAVVGKHADQWVDRLEVYRCVGTSYAAVTVDRIVAG